MPTTPTGLLSLPMKRLQDLICASSTFRTAVAAANAAAAAAHVFWDEAFPENVRPWAIIAEGDRTSTRTSTTGWDDESQIVMCFEFPETFTGATQDNEGPIIFRNTIGAIEAEMKAAIRTSPSLYPDLVQIDGPMIAPPDPKENDDERFYSAYYVFHYRGDGSGV